VIEIEIPRFTLTRVRSGLTATAIARAGQFIVLAGSRATARMGALDGAYRTRREALVADGSLAPAPDNPEHLVFTVDTIFASSTEAASVVLGTQINGPDQWIGEGGAKVPHGRTSKISPAGRRSGDTLASEDRRARVADAGSNDAHDSSPYPKRDFRRLAAVLQAIYALKEATLVRIVAKTGLDKRSVTRLVAAAPQVGVTVKKDGAIYKVIDWGPVIKPDGLEALLTGAFKAPIIEDED
jgi:hypothetical protein